MDKLLDEAINIIGGMEKLLTIIWEETKDPRIEVLLWPPNGNICHPNNLNK